MLQNFTYDLQQRKGYLGPIILFIFIWFLGLIWIAIRIVNNYNIDRRTDTFIYGINDFKLKEEVINKNTINKEKCFKSTIKGIIIAVIIFIFYIIIVAAIIIPIVVIANKQ